MAGRGAKEVAAPPLRASDEAPTSPIPVLPRQGRDPVDPLSGPLHLLEPAVSLFEPSTTLAPFPPPDLFAPFAPIDPPGWSDAPAPRERRTTPSGSASARSLFEPTIAPDPPFWPDPAEPPRRREDPAADQGTGDADTEPRGLPVVDEPAAAVAVDGEHAVAGIPPLADREGGRGTAVEPGSGQEARSDRRPVAGGEAAENERTLTIDRAAVDRSLAERRAAAGPHAAGRDAAGWDVAGRDAVAGWDAADGDAVAGRAAAGRDAAADRDAAAGRDAVVEPEWTGREARADEGATGSEMAGPRGPAGHELRRGAPGADVAAGGDRDRGESDRAGAARDGSEDEAVERENARDEPDVDRAALGGPVPDEATPAAADPGADADDHSHVNDADPPPPDVDWVTAALPVVRPASPPVPAPRPSLIGRPGRGPRPSSATPAAAPAPAPPGRPGAGGPSPAGTGAAVSQSAGPGTPGRRRWVREQGAREWLGRERGARDRLGRE